MKTTKLILAVALTCSAVGCRKSAEAERQEAAEAAEKADEVSRKARAEAVDEHNDYLAAVRREQLDYRERLHDELDDVDHKLNDLHVDITRDGLVHYDERRADSAKVKDLVDRRVLLRTDIDSLESSTEKDWDTVRAKLDADLGPRTTRRGRI
jgi:hypothetical protein